MSAQTSSTPEFALRLEGVALGYGDFTVLRDISMDVRAGQVVAVMGGSGCGKTTLLRAATGQITAQQGRVLAFGWTALEVAVRAQRIQGRPNPKGRAD